MIQPGFFDVANRLRDISVFGDPLERISQVGVSPRNNRYFTKSPG